MLRCNLRLWEMRAGARLYTAARAQRGCGRARACVKVLGHAIDNSRISYTFQWRSAAFAHCVHVGLFTTHVRAEVTPPPSTHKVNWWHFHIQMHCPKCWCKCVTLCLISVSYAYILFNRTCNFVYLIRNFSVVSW
jgi:hypothetical protein